MIIIKKKQQKIKCLRRKICQRVRNHCQNSQPQLLKCLHRVQRRGGVPLQDLHLVPVPHQRAPDQLIQQGLLGQVHFVPVSSPVSIFSPLRHDVACTGGNPSNITDQLSG